MMKRKLSGKSNLAILCALIIGLTLCAFVFRLHRTYFQRLTFDEIKTIRIYSEGYVDGERSAAVLSESDALRVHELLKQVELKGSGSDAFWDYVPYRTKMYILELNNGKVMEFSASPPFYIINSEKGFRSDYALCGELTALYTKLDKAYFPQEE